MDFSAKWEIRNSSNSFNYSCILSFSAVLDAFRRIVFCLVGLRDSMRLDCIEAAADCSFSLTLCQKQIATEKGR